MDCLFSIIIATFNRRECIERIFDSFKGNTPPKACNWEVVFVDNNSNDGTLLYLEEFSDNNKNVRVFKELRQGVSFARNRGALEARGRFIFFLDDDSVPRNDFLIQLERTLDHYQNIRVFGTKVISHFYNPPKWFATEGPYAMRGVLGTYDIGDINRPISNNDPLPIGSGILIERRFFQELGGFDINLGRKNGQKYPRSSEDTVFMQSVRESREDMFYIASIVIDHYPDVSKYSLAKLRKLFIGAGLGMGEREAYKYRGKKILNVPAFVLEEIIKKFLLLVYAYSRFDGKAIAFYKTRIWYNLGYSAYCISRWVSALKAVKITTEEMK